MTEVVTNIDYVEKFAYLPTQVSSGERVWWDYYWIKIVSYDPSLKIAIDQGYDYYLASKHIRLSSRDKEKDEMWRAITDDGS